MVKKLRIKIIAIIAVILSIILVVEIVSINVLTRKIGISQTEVYLSKIAQSEEFDNIDGKPVPDIIKNKDIPEPPSGKNPPPPLNNNIVTTSPQKALGSGDITRKTMMTGTPPVIPDKQHFNDNHHSITVDYFAIITDKSGNIYRTQNTDENGNLKSDVISYLTSKALKSNETTEIINNYQFYKQSKDYGYVLIFTNKSAENALMRKLMYISLLVMIIAMIIMLAVAVFISGYITKPVSEAFTKQKQFISDASHELKTPLTVISANADLLEEEIGENKWLGYIKSQTERMKTLVYELLDLSRMDAAKEAEKEFSEINLSEAVTNAALPFEGTAFELNKKYTINIEPDIRYYGNEKQIKQLVAIFVDNAMKYSNEGGNIRISLREEKDKILLEFYNTGCSIKDDERRKIFERFYRSDESRARQKKGGYGLGLAIAKSIADAHKMKITVDSIENEWIKFTIIM